MAEQHEIRLYALHCAVLSDAALFRACYARMPAYRQRKIDSMKRESDRLLSLGAGLLLEIALPAGASEKIAFGAREKPYLPDSGVHFNLSHAGEYAICAVGDTPLGCDIERLRNYNMRVARRFFCEEEAALLEAADPEERELLFFRLWTLKESYLKATGDGLGRPLSEARFEPDRNEVKYFGKEPYVFREYAVAPQYCCAVCATAPARFCGEIIYYDPTEEL